MKEESWTFLFLSSSISTKYTTIGLVASQNGTKRHRATSHYSGKSIAVWLHHPSTSESTSGGELGSGDAVNPLAALNDPWKKERGAILLFCPGHHTRRLC
jgi:hypothetical protein